MAARVVFLGEELPAAGYRLAGAAVRSPGDGGELAALEAARAEADLVLVSARLAARITPAALEAALAATHPLAFVVPELDGEALHPDAAERARRLLGEVA
jgi:vacuolar-type H+-ATPase subunit F/Vma7